MKSKLRFLAAAVGVALLPLTACAPGSSSEPGSDGGSTAAGSSAAGECTDEQSLRVWSWRSEDVEAYNRIFDVYEEKNPCVEVDFQAFKNTEYNQILSTGVTGSDGPDVVQLRAYGALQSLVAGGNLVPLDEKVENLSDIDPGILEGAKGKEDGLVYGIPSATQVMQVFYNKAIFEEQGLEVPTTWDEFTDLNEELLAAEITPLAVGGKDAWMMPIVHDIFGSAQYGGEEFRTKVHDGSAKFSDPEYAASIQTVKDLQPYMPKDVVGVSYTDSQVLFANEQAAMFPGGSFELAFFQNQNPDLDLGVFQVPVHPDSVLDQPVSPAYADGNWGINAASPKQEESLALVQWMATAEFGQLVADELKQFSPIAGVTFDDPVMKEIWELYQESPAPYLLLTDFRYGQPSGTDVMGSAIQELFLDSKDADDVSVAVQDGVSQWFKPQS